MAYAFVQQNMSQINEALDASRTRDYFKPYGFGRGDSILYSSSKVLRAKRPSTAVFADGSQLKRYNKPNNQRMNQNKNNAKASAGTLNKRPITIKPLAAPEYVVT